MTGFRCIARPFPAIPCGLLAAAALAALPADARAGPAATQGPEPALARAIAAPLLPVPHRLRGKPKRDSDGDGLSDWTEIRRTRTHPRRRDTDRDRLHDRVEVRRTRTNPRHRDTDRDRLSDWRELRRTGTNPRRADSDGDGVRDGAEVLAGSDPRNPASLPGVPFVQPPPPAPTPTPSPPPPAEKPDEDDEQPPPDSTPPETQIDSGPASPTNSDEASFEFSGSDPGGSGIASFQCRLDADAFAPCTSNLLLTALEAGNRKFEVRAVDNAGNADSSPAKHEWTIDLTPPAISVDSGPDGLTNDPTPTFGFNSEPSATFECSIDQGTPDFGPCSGASSHGPAEPLADGPHTFRVQATDAAGNTAVATRDFEVATTLPAAPELTETQPASPANENEPLVLGTAPAETTVRLYEGDSCSGSPIATVGVAELEAGIEVSVAEDSTTSFRATATTPAENASGCSEALAYVEDSTPPSVQVDSGPDGLTNDSSPNFGFSAEPDSSVQCSIDEGSADFGPCSTPSSHGPAEPLADGPHTFRVQATDPAGNQATATRDFEVDATPPQTQIDSGPPALTNSDEASFEFSGSDAGGSGIASFQCRLDGAAFEACSSGIELAGLAEGPHEFRVLAIDHAGNVDPSPALHEWTVDTTLPNLSIDSGPDGLTNDSSPNFGFSAEPGASVQCSIDGGTSDLGPCSGPDSHGPAEPLADGPHTFRVRATDAAGNTATATRDFEVDTALPAAPELTETQPASPANENEPLVLGTGPAGTTVRLYEGGSCSGLPVATVSAAELEAGIPVSLLDDSTTSFRATATTPAENTSGCSEALVYVEDSSPPGTQITVQPAAVADSDEATFEFEGDDGAGSGVAGFECSLDEAALAACASGVDYDELSEGDHEFEVRAIDNAGNADGSPAKHEWTIDLTPPAVSIDSGPDGLTNDPTPAFGFSAEPGATLQCSIDSGTPDFGPCSGANSHGPVEPLADGAHTFRVQATDAAGNQATATRDFEVDTALPAAPELTETQPASPANENEPVVLGTAPAETTIRLYEGGSCAGAPIATSSAAELEAGIEVSVGDDSTTTLRATATTEAENTSGCSEALLYVEDSTPPSVQVDSGPAGLTNDASPTFGFNSEPSATFECSIDQGTPDFGPCSSVSSHGPAEPLADGPHTFRVRATDAAGNTATATRDFEVDTALPPAPELTETQPASPANENEPVVLGTAPAETTIRLYEGGSCAGAPIATSSAAELEAGIEVSVADDTVTTFRATATTPAENTSGCSEALLYVEDSTPPQTQVDSGPTALTNSTGATFVFSGSDPGGSGISSFQCKLDEGSFAACSSGIELAGLGEGDHEFEVRAVDNAGNADGSPAKHEWTIDLTPPAVSIDSGPDGLTNDPTPAFGFSAEPGTSVVCSIDEGTPGFGPCSSAASHSPAEPLADGAHTFRVRATDAAGNTATATRDFEVDTALPPAPELTETQPASPADGNEPLVLGTASAETTVRLYEGGSCAGLPVATVGVAELEAGIEVSVADDTITTFRATATTPAENTSGCSEALLYVEDSTPPSVQVDSGPAGLTNDASPTFGFNSEPSPTFECSIDQGTPDFGSCSGPASHGPAEPLADGAHTFRVRATDAAGNQATATRDFEVDATPPQTQIDSGPPSPTNSDEASFEFSGSDPGGSGIASFECRLDGAAFEACSSGTELAGLAEGLHEFRVRAIDNAGNVDPSPALHEWRIDTTPPNLSIDSGPDGLTNDPSPTFGFSSEPSATFECSIDQGTPDLGSCSGPGSHGPAEPLADGPHTVRVRATDAAGNQATATRDFEVDATPPQTQIDSGPPALTDSDEASFEFSGSDPGGSGIASFQCRLDADAFAPCTSSLLLTALEAGNRKFEVRAVDNAGNADGSPAKHEWTIDLTPPAISVDYGPDGLTNDPTPAFGFSAEPGASVVCSIDEGTPGFGPCSSAASHSPAEPLADGAHTFRVRATDTAGNQATATRDFEVDTALPPAPELTETQPASPANENEPLVLGTASAETTVRLYKGGSCAGSPVATVGVAELEAGIEVSVADDSTTSFRATATTPAENTSGCSEALLYVEDSTPPETQIDSGPPSLTNSDEASFEFSGSDPGGSGLTFECRLDAEPFAGCASSLQLSSLSGGQRRFEVRAVDDAGNVDPTPAIHEWTVDLTAPQPAIDSLSKTLLKSGETSKVTWHADENGTFNLRVGGTDCDTGSVASSGAYAAVPEPVNSIVSAGKLAEGANTLRLCLTDAAGNRGSVTTTLSKDTTSPDTQIGTEPDPFTQSTTASFSFSGTDAGGSGVAFLECSKDDSPWAPCTSPREYTELAEGPHEFEVRAVDQAGNIDPIPASVNWTVDNTPPAPSIDSGPDGLTSNPSPSFGFSSEPGATFECSIDAGEPAFGPCSGAATHTPATPLADGTHTFRLRATDQAGNQATATRGFEVDTTAPPEPQLTSTAPASPTNENEPVIAGTAASDTTVRLYTGGSCAGTEVATVTPAELEAGVPVAVPDDSTTVFRATASTAERTSGCSEPLAYVEDSTPPETTIASSPLTSTYSTSASFFFTANEPAASFECSLDGKPFAPCASPRSHADLAPGEHSFAVRATDPAGNLEATPAEWSWTIEPPTAPPSACTSGGTEATTATAVRTAVEAGQNVCVTTDVGNVDLSDLGARPVVVSSSEGSMGDVDLSSTTDLTITQARLRAITLRNSHRTALLGNAIGGTQTERALDQLIFMPETNDDVRIEANDIGWTIADNSGNTGYGCRCYGDLNRLRFVGNRLHNLAADGFQGVGGVDVLIDRNEIGPVGRNPGSNEHSDNIQITGNDANLRITNNWIHNQGYHEGEITANAGSTYIHGGDDSSLTYENNLIETAQGRTEICGLGTGGDSRSNLTVRRNTWIDGGLAFANFPSFEWDCDAGEGNTITRNVAIDADGGFLDNGYDAAIVAPNLFGDATLVTLDADGNCTSANCNPAAEEPLGYRKPSGVSW